MCAVTVSTEDACLGRILPFDVDRLEAELAELDRDVTEIVSAEIEATSNV